MGDYVKCGYSECHVIIKKSSWDGDQYCTKDHRTIVELQNHIQLIKDTYECDVETYDPQDVQGWMHNLETVIENRE